MVRGGETGRAFRHTRPAPGARVRSPFFSGHLFQDIEVQRGQYPRAGYRTVQIFLARQDHVLSADRAYRLWRQAGLQVLRRRPRRRVATSRPRPLPPTGINHVWAYDFVFDTCADGRTLKCLTVIDEFTRECLAIDVAGAFDPRASSKSSPGW